MKTALFCRGRLEDLWWVVSENSNTLLCRAVAEIQNDVKEAKHKFLEIWRNLVDVREHTLVWRCRISVVSVYRPWIFFHLGPLLCWWGESFQSQGKYSKCGGNCGVLYHHSPFLPGPQQPLEGNKSSFLFLQFPCPTISFLLLARILPIILLFYWEFLITGVLLKAQIIFYGLLNKR